MDVAEGAPEGAVVKGVTEDDVDVDNDEEEDEAL